MLGSHKVRQVLVIGTTHMYSDSQGAALHTLTTDPLSRGSHHSMWSSPTSSFDKAKSTGLHIGALMLCSTIQVLNSILWLLNFSHCWKYSLSYPGMRHWSIGCILVLHVLLFHNPCDRLVLLLSFSKHQLFSFF